MYVLDKATDYVDGMRVADSGICRVFKQKFIFNQLMCDITRRLCSCYEMDRSFAALPQAF